MITTTLLAAGLATPPPRIEEPTGFETMPLVVALVIAVIVFGAVWLARRRR